MRHRDGGDDAFDGEEGGRETTLELQGSAGWVFLRKRKRIVGHQNPKEMRKARNAANPVL